MKILIVMDPGIMIPVKGYGGHERLVEMFAKEYLRQGNEVHLLVTSGSEVDGCTVHNLGKAGFPPKKLDAKMAVIRAWKFLRSNWKKFDLIHNFGRLAYLLPVLHSPVKKIMTYGREITSNNIDLANLIGSKNLVFTACSCNLLSRVRASGNWEVVYNAIEFNKYQLTDTDNLNNDAPLIFLGRIEKVKGCHTAIQVAKATGHKLIIAGNISPLEDERKYYEDEIFPHIDGDQIRYVGTVNDKEKNEWLGKAKALLFPIEWNEPFGIVMIEAMACGTPVIGFNVGSVNEVIDEGITGLKVHTFDEMVTAVKQVHRISRQQCREIAYARFNVSIIARRYLEVCDQQKSNVVIVSTHQPAANPRAFKEYETLKSLGYKVKYLYGYNADWSYWKDEAKFASCVLPRQDFAEIGGNPHVYPEKYFISRLLYRVFRIGASLSSFCKEMSAARSAFSIWSNINKYPADLYIAHYLGALPAALKAAKKYHSKVIFDAEDFHRGEQSYYKDQVKNIVATEKKLLPEVDAITTASPLITEEYLRLFPEKKVYTINNVFSKRFLQPAKIMTGNRLKLFWVSQNIGKYRGLEIFIQALNELPDADITLTIMGNRRSAPYESELLALSNKPERVTFMDTVVPEEVFAIAGQHDVGLAGEVPNCYNKEICLSNKIFTYMLAGNAILASDMKGQKLFMKKYPEIGFIYRYDDPKDLAEKIFKLYQDTELLNLFKSQSRKLSETLVNWEEEKEKWIRILNMNEPEKASNHLSLTHAALTINP